MPDGGRIGATVLAIGLVLAACSGSDTGEDDTTTAPGDDPVIAEAAADVDRPEASPDAGADAEGEDASEGEDPEPLPSNTLVWVVATEPPDLHLDDPANGLTITSWIRQGLLESLFGVGPDLTYHPELLASEPVVTPQDDASVVIEYRLRSDLVWSDGAPLTADDVAYTHRILTEGCRVEGDGSILDSSDEGCVYRAEGRVGYDQVTDFEVVSETDFTVTMAGFYPDWRRLYGPVLAAHAYGDDAGQVNQRLRTMTGPSGPLPSSGPLMFDDWERGVSMTLIANPGYHGSSAPHAVADGSASIEAVRIEFEPDPAARVQAIIDGRADLLMERPRPGHQAFAGVRDVAIGAVGSLDFDHWGLNLLNPHLTDPDVRRAVALAIDKAAMVEAVFGPLLGDEAAVATQGNTYWLANQPAYVDHQEALTGGAVDEARAALAAAGYQQGTDGTQRHPTRGPLRLRVTTIGGDPLRELGQAILIDQLAEIGIDARADNPAGGRFFQQGPFAPEALAASASEGRDGDASLWDIAQFGWAGGPWPGAQSGVYRNGSPGNPYGFSNPEFEVKAFECDALVNDQERDGCYNELDRFVTTLDSSDDGLFMIPLFQRSVLVVHRENRLIALPQVVGTPRGGPLATIGDAELAAG